MSVNPQLSVRIDTETIREKVLSNIIKMIYHRGWIKRENIESKTKSILNDANDENLYKVKLDVKLGSYPTYEFSNANNTEFDDNIVYIKLVPQKVTSVGKSPIILDFLTIHKQSHKILIVDEISDKSRNAIMTTKYIEIFVEKKIMQNVMEHVFSPTYEILTPDESTQLLKEYQLTKRQMKIMFDSDPVAQYLFLRKGRIVRIIRNSEASGNAVDYRIVVHKN